MMATIELIAEKGFDRATTSEISERAGYSSAMVHVRYGSKEALLESLQRAYEAEFLQPPDARETGLETVLEQIETLRTQVRKNPDYLRAFLMLCFETVGSIPSLRPWIRDWFTRYVSQVEAAVRKGQEDGSIRDDLDPRAEAQHFLDVGTGLCFTWLIRPEASDFDAAAEGWATRLRAWLSVST